MTWLTPFEVERTRVYPKLNPEQRAAYFGHLRGSSPWIWRFLDFTADEDGEAEVLAQIDRYGYVEARTYQLCHYNGPAEEWGAIGDVSSREQDRKQGPDARHQIPTPLWLKLERQAKQFWKDAANTAGKPEPPPRRPICVNCGEIAVYRWQDQLYCEDCVPEEAHDG